MQSEGPSRPYNRRPKSLAKLKSSLSLTDQSQPVHAYRGTLGVVKTLKAGPARASPFLAPDAGMENNQFHLFQRIEECRLIFEMPRAGAYKLT